MGADILRALGKKVPQQTIINPTFDNWAPHISSAVYERWV